MGVSQRRSNQRPEDLSRIEEVRSSSDRTFGFVFAAIFAGIGTVGLWNGAGTGMLWLLGAFVLGALALIRPSVLSPINRMWTAFGLLLHRLMTPLILGIMFFLVITPIAMLMRVFGKDSLRLSLEKEAASYWISRDPPGPAPEDIRRQF